MAVTKIHESRKRSERVTLAIVGMLNCYNFLPKVGGIDSIDGGGFQFITQKHKKTLEQIPELLPDDIESTLYTWKEIKERITPIVESLKTDAKANRAKLNDINSLLQDLVVTDDYGRKITNEMLAKCISRHLKDMGSTKTVGKSLVDKWCSRAYAGGENYYEPSDEQVLAIYCAVRTLGYKVAPHIYEILRKEILREDRDVKGYLKWVSLHERMNDCFNIAKNKLSVAVTGSESIKEQLPAFLGCKLLQSESQYWLDGRENNAWKFYVCNFFENTESEIIAQADNFKRNVKKNLSDYLGDDSFFIVIRFFQIDAENLGFLQGLKKQLEEFGLRVLVLDVEKKKLKPLQFEFYWFAIQKDSKDSLIYALYEANNLNERDFVKVPSEFCDTSMRIYEEGFLEESMSLVFDPYKTKKWGFNRIDDKRLLLDEITDEQLKSTESFSNC